MRSQFWTFSLGLIFAFAQAQTPAWAEDLGSVAAAVGAAGTATPTPTPGAGLNTANTTTTTTTTTTQPQVSNGMLTFGALLAGVGAFGLMFSGSGGSGSKSSTTKTSSSSNTSTPTFSSGDTLGYVSEPAAPASPGLAAIDAAAPAGAVGTVVAPKSTDTPKTDPKATTTSTPPLTDKKAAEVGSAGTTGAGGIDVKATTLPDPNPGAKKSDTPAKKTEASAVTTPVKTPTPDPAPANLDAGSGSETSLSDAIAQAGACGAGQTSSNKSMGLCFEGVVDIIAQGIGKNVDCVRKYIGGNGAILALNTLPREGFKKYPPGSSACKTRGAVLVYTGAAYAAYSSSASNKANDRAGVKYMREKGMNWMPGDTWGHIEVYGGSQDPNYYYYQKVDHDGSMRGRRELAGCFIMTEVSGDLASCSSGGGQCRSGNTKAPAKPTRRRKRRGTS